MPNQVTSHTERTLFKAFTALMGDNDMSVTEAQQAIDRVLNAGLLFREPPEPVQKETKSVPE